MISQMTDAQIESAHRVRQAYPQAFAGNWHKRIWLALCASMAFAVLVYGFWSNGIEWARFVSGLSKLGTLPAMMFPPSLGHYPLWSAQLGPHVFVKALTETIAMAFLGTLMGAVCAFPLSFFAAKNMTRARPLQFGTRRFADLLRSFDYLIWALIFVRAIGLGPLAGIMAIAIVEIGTFIKLYSEAIENLDRKQSDGIIAAGGNGLQRIRFGVLPQVLPMMLSNTLYMFEHNVRSASILGIVGAGGIGFLLADRLRAYELQEACLIIIVLIVAVYAIDYLSKILRERLIGDHRRREPVDDAVQV